MAAIAPPPAPAPVVAHQHDDEVFTLLRDIAKSSNHAISEQELRTTVTKLDSDATSKRIFQLNLQAQAEGNYYFQESGMGVGRYEFKFDRFEAWLSIQNEQVHITVPAYFSNTSSGPLMYEHINFIISGALPSSWIFANFNRGTFRFDLPDDLYRTKFVRIPTNTIMTGGDCGTGTNFSVSFFETENAPKPLGTFDGNSNQPGFSKALTGTCAWSKA